MGLVGYLALKFGCFRRRADPLFNQDKEMKFKLWKFRCRHNQWGETWGLRGRCRRAFELPLNPLIKALVCSEARWVLPPQIGKPRAPGLLGKPGLLAFMLQVKKHSWTLK